MKLGHYLYIKGKFVRYWFNWLNRSNNTWSFSDALKVGEWESNGRSYYYFYDCNIPVTFQVNFHVNYYLTPPVNYTTLQNANALKCGYRCLYYYRRGFVCQWRRLALCYGKSLEGVFCEITDQSLWENMSGSTGKVHAIFHKCRKIEFPWSLHAPSRKSGRKKNLIAGV